MFKAKTQWFVNLGAYEMVRGDQKMFSAGGKSFGWATVEVTAVDVVLQSAGELLLELRVLKKDKGYVRDHAEDLTSVTHGPAVPVGHRVCAHVGPRPRDSCGHMRLASSRSRPSTHHCPVPPPSGIRQALRLLPVAETTTLTLPPPCRAVHLPH